MKNKNNLLYIILFLIIIILVFFIFQYFMTKNYLEKLRSSPRNVIKIERKFEDGKEFVALKSLDLLKSSPLIAIKVNNKNNRAVNSMINMNYSSEISVDKYLVNYSNSKNFQINKNSENVIYLIPYLSDCFFKIKNCKGDTPIFQNIEISKIQNLNIEEVYSIDTNNLPFLIELVDANQKYLFPEINLLYYLKDLFKIGPFNKNGIDIINNLKVVDHFKENLILKNDKIRINKRVNSFEMCSGKFNKDINLKPKYVSICGQEFKTIETEKLFSNGNYLSINGKLYKGSLLLELENQFGEKIFRTVSKKGNFNLTIELPESDYFKIEINSVLNAYNFPEIKFDINSALIY